MSKFIYLERIFISRKLREQYHIKDKLLQFAFDGIEKALDLAGVSYSVGNERV